MLSASASRADRRGWIAGAALSLLCCACAAGGEPAAAPATAPTALRPASTGPRVELGYAALDGTPVTTDGLLHRLSVIGLLASYDPSSQTQAIYLRALARRHRPRINVVIVVLEPPENLPLVEAFAEVLAAPFPVVLADEATLLGRGPFGDLREVPSIVVLDRGGREAWRHVGQVDVPGLEAVLRSLEAGAGDAPSTPASASEQSPPAGEPEDRASGTE